MNNHALLLADPSACLRHLVLKNLFGRGEKDAETSECARQRILDPVYLGIVEPLFEHKKSGSPELKSARLSVVAASFALLRLGFLGFDGSDRHVRALADFLFSKRERDGTWRTDREIQAEFAAGETLSGKRTISMALSVPLGGLAACGYAESPECRTAYERLLSLQLPDGAWPVYTVNGVYGTIAGYRRLAQSRFGCRTNTTFALLCLSRHPEWGRSEAARKALDLLLGRETREQFTLGLETARMIGIEPSRGFLTYFARFDLALVLKICADMGATREDERVGSLADFLLSLRNRYGLWENDHYPQATRWITYSILSSLRKIGAEGDWLPMRPRTPFRAYSPVPKRF
jgi:hypothetical protein